MAVTGLVVAGSALLGGAEQPEAVELDTSGVQPVQPGPIVAGTDDGRLVRVDPGTGRVEELADAAATGGRIGSLATGLDGAVYLAAHDPAVELPCESRVGRLDPASGAITWLAEGFAPAPSPDGRQLAWVAPAPRLDGTCGYSVTVRDASGAETTWRPDSWSRHGLCSVAWLDTRQLLVERCYETGSDVYVLAADEPEASHPRLLGPSSVDRSWTHPEPTPEGRVVVVEHCCPSRADGGVRLLEVDATGSAVRELPAPPGEVRDLAMSTDGQVATVAAPRGEGPAGSLWVDERPVPGAPTVVAVAWRATGS